MSIIIATLPNQICLQMDARTYLQITDSFTLTRSSFSGGNSSYTGATLVRSIPNPLVGALRMGTNWVQNDRLWIPNNNAFKISDNYGAAGNTDYPTQSGGGVTGFTTATMNGRVFTLTNQPADDTNQDATLSPQISCTFVYPTINIVADVPTITFTVTWLVFVTAIERSQQFTVDPNAGGTGVGQIALNSVDYGAQAQVPGKGGVSFILFDKNTSPVWEQYQDFSNQLNTQPDKFAPARIITNALSPYTLRLRNMTSPNLTDPMLDYVSTVNRAVFS